MTATRSHSRAPEELLAEIGLRDARAELLDYIRRQRWYAGRDRGEADLDIVDAGLGSGSPQLVPVLVDIVYAGGRRDRYQVPLSIRPADQPLPGDQAPVSAGERDGKAVLVYDALVDLEAGAQLWALVAGEGRIQMRGGAMVGRRLGEVEAVADASEIHPFVRDQSNTSLLRQERELLKSFRRIEAVSSPELEMLTALNEAGFASIAAPLGVVEYQPLDGPATVLAILQPYLHNATDGFDLALTSLRDLYAAAEDADPADRDIGKIIDEQGADFRPDASRLGQLVGEMHLALGSPAMPATMAPSEVKATTLRAWSSGMLEDLDALLGANPDLTRGLPQQALRRALGVVAEINQGGSAIRYHGDLHLSQVIRTDSGWVVLDFEGEPHRPVDERRLLSSPLRDVAGILRSFEYAAAVGLMERAEPDDADWARLQAFGDGWAEVNRGVFLEAYFAVAGLSDLLPRGDEAGVLMRAFEIQKAIYEVRYELGHRPDWARIPLRFLERQQ
jgi:maltokinase